MLGAYSLLSFPQGCHCRCKLLGVTNTWQSDLQTSSSLQMGRLCCVPYLPAATLRCPGRKKENVQMQNKAAGRMQDLVYLNKPGSIRSFTSDVLCFDCSDFWWLTSSSDNGQNPVQEKCGSSGLTSSIAVEALLLLGTLCQHCELSWLRIYPC